MYFFFSAPQRVLPRLSVLLLYPFLRKYVSKFQIQLADNVGEPVNFRHHQKTAGLLCAFAVFQHNFICFREFLLQ